MAKASPGRGASKKAGTPFHVSRRVRHVPLRESISYRLRRVSRGLMRSLEGRIAAFGIPAGAWFYLRVLWDEDNLSQIELAERAGVMGPTTFTAIRRLEQLGLVTQARDPHDRRKSLVRLTPAGRALETQTVPLSIDVMNMAMSGLSSADVDQLRRIADQMIRNLENDTLARGGRSRP